MENNQPPKLQSIVIPRNLIIESNNSTSKRSEISHNNNKNKEENVQQKPNNSSWNTVLSNTIELDVGDEVSISSASINQLGSGENNIEFLGAITDSEFVDNKLRMNMSYYITNELKFNLPLPLSTTVFAANNENFEAVLQPNYMDIDISTLENFLKAYPASNLENLEFIGGKLYKPSDTRLYLGQRDWSGLYTDSYDLNPAIGFPTIKLDNDYKVHTNQIDIDVNIGLDSPANVASIFTNAFHQPINVDLENSNKYIKPISIVQTDVLDRNNIVLKDHNIFQENSYFAVSNTPARGLYLEKQRGLKNDFLFDGSIPYNIPNMEKILYENMLSGDPDRTFGVKRFQDLRKSRSFPDVLYHAPPGPGDYMIYSGQNDAFDYFKGSYNSGNTGNIGQNIVCADRLNVNTTRSFIKYNYSLEQELQTLKVEPGDVIMTNILNTEENILILKDVLHKIEYPVKDDTYPADVVDFNNKLFTNTLVSDLSFAMADESLTDYNHLYNNNLECYGRMVPHTRSRNDPDTTIRTLLTLPNSYLVNQPKQNIRSDYDKNYDKRYLISDDYLLQESFSNLNNVNSGQNKDWGYNVGVHSRYDANRVNNLPTASLFELNNVNNDLFEANDMGLVSAHRKLLLPNLSNDKQASYSITIDDTVVNSQLNGVPFTSTAPYRNVIIGNYVNIQFFQGFNTSVYDFSVEINDPSSPGSFLPIGLDSHLLNDYLEKDPVKKYFKQTLYVDPDLVNRIFRISYVSDDYPGQFLYLYFNAVNGTNTIFDQNYASLGSIKFMYPSRVFYFGANENISLANDLDLKFNLLLWKKYKFMLQDNAYTGQFDTGVFDNDGNLIPIVETLVSDAGRTIFVRMRNTVSTTNMYLHLRDSTIVLKRMHLIVPLTTGNVLGREQESLKSYSFLGFTVKKKFPISIPKISIFENFGISRSINDNEFAFPISIQKQAVSTSPVNKLTFYDVNNISSAYATSMMIGSNKLALDYDIASSRFIFSYLHQPKVNGQAPRYNFNDCIELTGPDAVIPEFNSDPGGEILTIYQEENAFVEDSHTTRNIIFGLGQVPPKGTTVSSGNQDPPSPAIDFNILYEADDLSRSIGATTLTTFFSWEFPNAVSIAQFDLYPAFPSGTVSDNGAHNYGFPVADTDTNRFPYQIELQVGDDLTTIQTYTAQTPITTLPVTDIPNDKLVPHPTSSVLADNIHAVQRILTNTKQAHKVWGFSLKLESDKTNYTTGSSLNIARNQSWKISKIIAYKEISTTNPDRYIPSKGIISAQCGSAIQSLEVPDINNKYQPLLSTNNLLYQNTLLDKIGFSLFSILPVFGKVQNFFETTEQSVNSELDSPGYLMRKFLTRPFTTNARVDGAVIQALVRNAYIMPVFNQGIPSFDRPAVTTAVGDTLSASDISDSFNFPYLVIYSNIIPTDNDFYGGPEVSPINVFAVVNRSYASGNYLFLQGTDISYVVQKKTIINNFDVQIKLPDGNPLILSTNSSVIFKINKKKEIFIQN